MAVLLKPSSEVVEASTAGPTTYFPEQSIDRQALPGIINYMAGYRPRLQAQSLRFLSSVVGLSRVKCRLVSEVQGALEIGFRNLSLITLGTQLPYRFHHEYSSTCEGIEVRLGGTWCNGSEI